MSDGKKLETVTQQDVKGFVDRLLEEPMTEETRFLAKRLMSFLYSWLGLSLTAFLLVFVIIYMYAASEIYVLVIWAIIAAIPWFIVTAILILKHMMKMEQGVRQHFRENIGK